MDIIDYSKLVCKEIEETVSCISKTETQSFYNVLLSKRNQNIFVYGAGRCGYVLRAFCMRLMHLGYNTYFVPDTNTPAVQKGDLFIVADGAGFLTTVSEITRLAKKNGADICALTIIPDSTIGLLGDIVIKIPGRTTAHGGIGESIQPGGAKFEQSLFIFLDCIIAALAEQLGFEKDSSFSRHNNLE